MVTTAEPPVTAPDITAPAVTPTAEQQAFTGGPNFSPLEGYYIDDAPVVEGTEAEEAPTAEVESVGAPADTPAEALQPEVATLPSSSATPASTQPPEAATTPVVPQSPPPPAPHIPTAEEIAAVVEQRQIARQRQQQWAGMDEDQRRDVLWQTHQWAAKQSGADGPDAILTVARQQALRAVYENFLQGVGRIPEIRHALASRAFDMNQYPDVQSLITGLVEFLSAKRTGGQAAAPQAPSEDQMERTVQERAEALVEQRLAATRAKSRPADAAPPTSRQNPTREQVLAGVANGDPRYTLDMARKVYEEMDRELLGRVT